MTLLNVAYTPKCNLNLISLSQLRELGISYHNHSDSMMLKQGKTTLKMANKEKNLFILKIGLKERVILMQKRDQPIYHLSTNLKI